MASMLTILEGSTFRLSDERGDIVEETSGLFAYDTCSSPGSFSGSATRARCFSPRPHRPLRGRVLPAQLDRRRAAARLGLGRAWRFVATGMRERIAVRNESMETLRFELSLELAADFADIISVKLHDFALEIPRTCARPAAAASASYDEAARQLLIEPQRGDLRTRRRARHAGRLEDGRMVFDLDLDPHELWELDVEFHPTLDGEGDPERGDRLAEERETLGDVVAAWTLRVPRVRGGWESLRRAFDRSIDDLAALRMRTGESRRLLFAAGMPGS